MDTRSLIYFIAVAEEQNIGRAATRLHITQPALTRQIHSLEDEVGVPLFTRTKTGVEITPAGVVLLQHARTIKAELAQAKLNAQHAQDTRRQEMHIGVYGSAIFSIVPPILRRFAEAHPDVDFRLHNTRKDQQIELLRQGKVMIVFDRYLPEEDDMAYELVYREYLQAALYKDHPLASRETLDFADLDAEARIGANFTSPLNDSLARSSQLRPLTRHRADDMLTTLALVSAGLGITFAPPSIESLQIPNVVFRSYTGGPRIPFDVHCMYRRSERAPLLQALLETVRAMRNLPPQAGA